MADQPENKAAEDKASETKRGRKPPIKTILVVLGLLAAEGVAVVGVLTLWGRPGEVQGSNVDPSQMDLGEQLHEVLIVHDKFPNHHTGRVWLWDTEVQIQVKQKHLDHVKRALEERQAEIKTGVSRIIRNAHQNHLQEPNLQTLTRQLTQYLRDVLGTGPDAEERVQQVLIPRCVGFPADF